MTEHSVGGRAGWLRRIVRFFRGRNSARASAKPILQRAKTTKAAELDQRPRFSEPLESRRMLTATVPISFAPVQFYPNVSGSLAIGNFVNGGLPDIVGTDGTNNAVHVLINNGDGTFHAGQSFSVQNARAAAVADFNGDGNQDIAVLSDNSGGGSSESTVDIFFGRGDGTFLGTPRQVPLPYSVRDIGAADFNGDGIPDLVITTGHHVILLLNKGDGHFDAPEVFDAGAQISGELTIGDFNHDGIPDIALTRFETPKIAILLGQSINGVPDGKLGKPEIYKVGNNPRSITVGDFNGDGIEDLAVANSSFREPSFFVLLGNGDGTFGKPQPFAGGDFTQGITAGDYNGDGLTDIATVAYTSFLRVYAGNGDGTFQPFKEFDNSAYGQRVMTADFNGDGLDDIAIATGGGIRVFLATKPSTPVPPPSTSLSATIGAGGPKSLLYQDAAGYRVRLSLLGPGSATIDLSGQNLSLNDTASQVIGGTATLSSIAATGTTSDSTLLVSPLGLNAHVNVGAISSDGSFRAIVAPLANLVGNITIAGSVGRIAVDNATDSSIATGPGDVPINITISNALDENLTTGQTIGSLVVGEWFSPDGVLGQITAPGIGHITGRHQFGANLTIGSGGIHSIFARNIPEGTWTVAGAVGNMSIARDAQISLTAPSLASLSLGNELNNAVLNIAGNIGSLTAGSMLNSSIYADVGPLPTDQRLPDSAGDFTGNARIDSVVLRRRRKYSSWINDSIAAPTIGRLSVGVIAFQNGGELQGLAAQRIGTFAGLDDVTKKAFLLHNPFTLNSLSAMGINPADFVLRIV